MLTEKYFEDIICEYPDLIEEGLRLIGRQVRLYGEVIDILFEDKFGQKLIVELKVGPIDRKTIGQGMGYEGNVLSAEDPTARLMLVANRVPPNLRKALNHHGIEWKEITISQLKEFLINKNDKEFLKLFEEEVSVQIGKNIIQHEKIVQSELVSPAIDDITDAALISSIQQGSAPYSQHIKRLDEKGKELFKLLHCQIISIGPGISAISNIDSIAYKTSENFCDLHTARVPREDKRIRNKLSNFTMHLITFGKQLIDEDNLILYYRRGGRRRQAVISIGTTAEIEKAVKLIRQCYFESLCRDLGTFPNVPGLR